MDPLLYSDIIFEPWKSMMHWCYFPQGLCFRETVFLRGPGAYGQRMASTNYSGMAFHRQNRTHSVYQLDFCCCGLCDFFSFYHLSYVLSINAFRMWGSGCGLGGEWRTCHPGQMGQISFQWLLLIAGPCHFSGQQIRWDIRWRLLFRYNIVTLWPIPWWPFKYRRNLYEAFWFYEAWESDDKLSVFWWYPVNVISAWWLRSFKVLINSLRREHSRAQLLNNNLG